MEPEPRQTGDLNPNLPKMEPYRSEDMSVHYPMPVRMQTSQYVPIYTNQSEVHSNPNDLKQSQIVKRSVEQLMQHMDKSQSFHISQQKKWRNYNPKATRKKKSMLYF